MRKLTNDVNPKVLLNVLRLKTQSVQPFLEELTVFPILRDDLNKKG